MVEVQTSSHSHRLELVQLDALNSGSSATRPFIAS
jgi:hypothetical protein